MIIDLSKEIYPLFDLIKNGIVVTDSKSKIISEISVLRSEEYKNINLAHHDPLTNLENRTALEEGFIRNTKRIQRQYFKSDRDEKNKEKLAN